MTIMILIEKSDSTFNLSYLKYLCNDSNDIEQFVKYGLESWEIAQLLGCN